MDKDIKMFADVVDNASRAQIDMIMDQPPFAGRKVRIMPDCHAGAGCVIGFTADLGDKVVPNVIGVDIGCGMRVAELGKGDIDLPALDAFIKENIPAGMEVNAEPDGYAARVIGELYCKDKLNKRSRLAASLGTLGGGNHFIEVDRDGDELWLVVHTGSRNLGKQVADYYQRLAVDRLKTHAEEIRAEIKAAIKSLSEQGRGKDIPKTVEAIKSKLRKAADIPDALCYLEGKDMDDYMHDMRICQRFAVLNRTAITKKLLSFLGKAGVPEWESVHNYIDELDVIRKGAIAAHKGERVIIPMNMRDGCIIGVGKGNSDWNESAPHGAGRIMSRGEAIKTLSVKQFRIEMRGIYTTTVDKSTIDEAPMAYKPMSEILKYLGETVEVERIIKPIYNFKASEGAIPVRSKSGKKPRGRAKGGR